MLEELEGLDAALNGLSAVRACGRVSGAQGGLITVDGLSARARVGDRIDVQPPDGRSLGGIVTRIDGDQLQVLPDHTPDGVAVGHRAILQPPSEFAPCDAWLGRVIDPVAHPLDSQPLPRGRTARAVMTVPHRTARGRGFGAAIETKLHVFNTFLPLVRGQRIGVFAGSGVGKSRLLAQLGQSIDADVVVIALVLSLIHI